MQWVEGRGLKTESQIKIAGSHIGGMHQERPTGHLFVRDEEALHCILQQRFAKTRALFGLVYREAGKQRQWDRVTPGTLSHALRGALGFDGCRRQAVIADDPRAAKRDEATCRVGSLGKQRMPDQIVVERRTTTGEIRYDEFRGQRQGARKRVRHGTAPWSAVKNALFGKEPGQRRDVTRGSVERRTEGIGHLLRHYETGLVSQKGFGAVQGGAHDEI